MAQKDKFAQPWRKIARDWKNMDVPNIPPQDEQDIYEKYIQLVKASNKNAQALVLGCTVQIRDLLYKNKVATTVCDLSLEMILALTSLSQYNLAQNETWVKADWISAPLTQDYFNIILADGSINQLPQKLYVPFLKKVKALLKEEGLFVQRTAVTRKNYWQDDHKILEHYLHQKNPKPDILFETLFAFSSALDKKTCKVSVNGVYKIMDQYLKKSSGEKRDKLQRIIKKMEKSYNRSEKTWTVPLLEEMTKLYKRHFELVKVEFGRGYDTFIPGYPIYVLEK